MIFDGVLPVSYVVAPDAPFLDTVLSGIDIHVLCDNNNKILIIK